MSTTCQVPTLKVYGHLDTNFIQVAELISASTPWGVGGDSDLDARKWDTRPA